jgi:hypothetical protein
MLIKGPFRACSVFVARVSIAVARYKKMVAIAVTQIAA